MNVHNSLSHKIPKLEATQISINITMGSCSAFTNVSISQQWKHAVYSSAQQYQEPPRQNVE